MSESSESMSSPIHRISIRVRDFGVTGAVAMFSLFMTAFGSDFYKNNYLILKEEFSNYSKSSMGQP